MRYNLRRRSHRDGAICAPDTLQGLGASALLDNIDGHDFFSALGDLVVSGPTGANINDFRAILIL